MKFRFEIAKLRRETGPSSRERGRRTEDPLRFHCNGSTAEGFMNNAG